MDRPDVPGKAWNFRMHDASIEVTVHYRLNAGTENKP